jgi:hypothetical protein
LRAWAQTQAVFISSVMGELATERRLLASLVAELGATPVLFEDFGGRDQGAQEAYLSGVARSAIYLGVVADRYGAMTSTGRSATHEVRLFHTTGSFTDPENLARRVQARLVEIAAEDLAPWVKLDVVVFRADRITDRGSQVRVEARCATRRLPRR